MKRVFQMALAASLFAGPLFVLAPSSRGDTMADDDKKLNAAYEHLIKDIRAHNDKDKAELVIGNLREAQRAWLKYRESQLAFVGTYSDVGSGSARSDGLAQYSHELTEARIKDFQTVPNPF